MSCRAPKRPRDDGAAAVEFALLFPIFFMVCIGTITFGFAFERWISVTQAAREASRFAATYPNPDDPTWAADVLLVAKENAGITAETPADSYYVCVRFTAADSSTASNVVESEGTLAPATCPPATSLPDSRVALTVRRSAQVNWLFGGNDLAVTGSNTSRFEPGIS